MEPIEAIKDYRDFFECSRCGFAGIGYVVELSNGETVGECDVCERQTILAENNS